MKKNIQENFCILLNLYIGPIFLQETVFCYTFSWNWGVFLSFLVLFYCIKPALNKIKENPESKVYITAEILEGTKKDT